MERNGLRTLWTECFGDEDGWIDAFFGTAFAPENVCALTRQGRPAAALCWMDVFCDGRKLAYLYAIGTHPVFRRQGLCRELMDMTHETLARQGYTGSILVPADGGLRKMYGNMGYGNFGGIREITAREGKPTPVQEVMPEEYAVLRREFLPAGGVVQEAGAEKYLAAGARLYTGADFLLAMSQGGLGIELLGNAHAAPGILGALGMERGTFRTPGNAPYAMYRSLTGEDWKPGYFGLAFE